MAENEFYKDKPSYYLLESFYFITEIISAVFVTRTVSSVKIQCNTRSMSVKDQKKRKAENKLDWNAGIWPNPALVTQGLWECTNLYTTAKAIILALH